MNNILVALLVATTTLGAAQEKKDPKVEAGLRQLAGEVARERAEIMQVIEAYEKAFAAKDLDGIMAIYDPKVVAYDINPPLRYEGTAAYRNAWKEFIDAYDGPIDMEIRDLQLLWSGDIAVTHNLERFAGVLKGGPKTEMWVRVTSVFHKVGGRWRIVHEHVSVPTDFATGKSLTDLKP
jgi:uncharacterized protein (TIGR02246 family)